MKEELWLDVTSGKVISSTEPLKSGKLYRITMQGTYSVWRSISQTGPHSGQPEPAPMWPSEGKANHQVGLDPEFLFAWPPGSSASRKTEPSPRRASAIQMSLDGGESWAHPPCSEPFNATDHKYNYDVTGEGHPLQIRFVDRPYGDNYGRVHIEILPGGSPDNLTRIEGIGPKTSALLQAAGIRTFNQLAATPVADLEQILRDGGNRFSLLEPGTWPEQSALAAAGKWDELKELQAKLDGGQRV